MPSQNKTPPKKTKTMQLRSRPKAVPRDKASYHHGDLRQAITSAAVALITTKGEATFTLREIAGTIAVSHAAVYRHFANKRAILAAVAEEGFKKLIASLAPLPTLSHKDTKELIRIQFENYIRFAIENPGHFKAMFHQELSEKKDFPSLEHISSAAGDLLMQTAQKILDSAPSRKDPPESLALAFWSMMHGFAELALNRQFPTAKTHSSPNSPVSKAMGMRIAEVATILLDGMA